MTQKLGRNYALTISGTATNNAPILINVSLPLTVEFDITRNTLTSANVCQIRVRNLNVAHRNEIRKNVTSYSKPIVNVTLRAGYGNNLPIIFTGNVSQAWSVREGTDFITQIECFDAGFAFINGQVNMTFPANTPYQTIIAEVMQTLPGVTVGAVGDYPGATPKQTTYSGATVDILNQLTGNGFFIDLGTGNALGNGETLKQDALVINAATGLLGTPVLEQNIVRFDMLFEPSLAIGRLVNLKSASAEKTANFDGNYKITAIKHRGMISDVVSGTVTTTGEFFSLGQQTGVANFE